MKNQAFLREAWFFYRYSFSNISLKRRRFFFTFVLRSLNDASCCCSRKQAYPERWRDWPCETLATISRFTGRKVLIPICRNAERDKPEKDFQKKIFIKISSGFPEEIFF
jgi:hypothetical protein